MWFNILQTLSFSEYFSTTFTCFNETAGECALSDLVFRNVKEFFTLGLYYNPGTTKSNSCWNKGMVARFRYQGKNEPELDSLCQ